MKNISDAVTTMGIVFFAFQFTYHIHYVETPSETKEQIHSNFGALVASVVKLCDILHILETQPRNPMISLPTELGAAIQAAVSVDTDRSLVAITAGKNMVTY